MYYILKINYGVYYYLTDFDFFLKNNLNVEKQKPKKKNLLRGKVEQME